MQLLLRRNYLVLTIQQTSTEFVAVETLAGDRFHERWCGFESPLGEGRPLLLPCNGWRNSECDAWNYLDHGEFVAGCQTPAGIVGLISDNSPVIVER